MEKLIYFTSINSVTLRLLSQMATYVLQLLFHRVHVLSNRDMPVKDEREHCFNSRSVEFEVTHITSDQEVIDVSHQTRKCRFAEEIEKPFIYRYYSYKTCWNNCIIKDRIRQILRHYNRSSDEGKYWAGYYMYVHFYVYFINGSCECKGAIYFLQIVLNYIKPATSSTFLDFNTVF